MVPKKETDLTKLTLGQCADLLYKTRNERLAQQKIAEAIEAEEGRIREYIIQTLPRADKVAGGRVAKVERYETQVPKVNDWEKLYKWIKRNDRFDVLQRRVADKAVIDMWEDKKQVPGVEPFTIVKLSLTKV